MRDARIESGTAMATIVAVAGLAAAGALVGGCSRTDPPDLAKARAVMEELLAAEREHRASHGNYWRDRQPKVDRDHSIRNVGVDVGEARGFEFTMEPAEDGMDKTLRVTASAGSVSLSCVQAAAEPKPVCKESGGS
jgi:hypothetical protein